MNAIPATELPPVEILARYIRRHGPIQAVRVSSARAGVPYPYWGAVRGEVRNRKRDGLPAWVPFERATSDRRSRSSAASDANEIGESEGRVYVDPNRSRKGFVWDVLCQLAGQPSDATVDSVVQNLPLPV